MRRVLLPGILVYTLLLAGLVLLRGSLLALALPFVIYILVGLLRGPEEVRLEITRSVSPERSPLDQPVRVRLIVRNLGASLEHVLLQDMLPAALKVIEGKSSRLTSLPRGAVLTWEYSVSGPRGCYPLSTVNVTAGDHFGLVNIRQSIPTTGQVFFLPPVPRLRRVYIRPRLTLVYSGNIPARQGGQGVEFFGVREYRPGDSPQWINWHASARHPDMLYCNEFEQEHVTDVGVILDARRLTNIIKESSLFEHSVVAVSALSDAFLNSGNRVGLLVYGTYLHWTFTGYGKLQRERILQALARATIGDSLVFSDLAHLPARLFPANSQLVLVSPLHADDLQVLVQLRSRGYQLIVISPDPISFELQKLDHRPNVEKAARVLRMERNLLLTQLYRAGVQVVNWDVTRPFDQVVQGFLGRPLAWMRMIRR